MPLCFRCLFLILGLVLTGPWPETAGAASETVTTKSVSFEQCLEVIRRTAAQLGVAPVNIVETNALRMVRFPVADGSVLVSCSRPDRKMVITKSDKRS